MVSFKFCCKLSSIWAVENIHINVAREEKNLILMLLEN